MIDRLARQLGKEERDLLVLKVVLEHHPIETSQIAEETEVDEYKARHSIRMLEDGGLVEPTPDGAVPADSVTVHIDEINAGLDALIARTKELKRFGTEQS